MAVMFTVQAQAYTTSQRISKTVEAASEAEVLRLVLADLDAAGFYPISIVPVVVCGDAGLNR
jgi:hypothetical protein